MTAFFRPCGKFFQPGLEIGQEISSDTKAEKSPCGSRFSPSKENSLPGNENLRRKIVCLRRVG